MIFFFETKNKGALVAKKKAKASKSPEPKPFSVRRWKIVTTLLVVAILLLGMFIAYAIPHQNADQQHTSTTPVTPNNNVAPVMTVVVDNPTPEQHRFIQRTFFPNWNRIRTSYPIPDLRGRFDKLLRRVESNEIRLQFGSLYCENRTRVLAEADREGSQRVIRFYTPAIQDFYKRVTSEEMRDDIIVGLLLHEEYHLNHHVFVPIQGGRPGHIKALREGETWWWCAETIYTPMLQQGRLRDIPPDDALNSVLRCYELAAGDPTSEAWMRFILADPTLKPH